MENNKQKEIVDLIKEWFELKKEITKIDAAQFIESQKSCIEGAGNQLMDYIKQMGRRYGQDIDEATKIAGTKDEDVGRIIEDYKEQIRKVTEIYKEKHQSILNEKAEWEAQLAQSDDRLLKIKIRENTNNWRIDTEKKKMSELINGEQYADVGNNANVLQKLTEERKKIEEDKKKELESRREIERTIKECEERIEQNQKDMEKEVDIKKALRDDEFHNLNETYLVVMKEESILQRAVFWIKNKINGSKRFANDIITPLRKGIQDLKENKITKIKKNIEKSSIVKKAKEYTFDIPKEFVKGTYGSIIEFYQKQKEKVVKSLETSISSNKEELEQKRQKDIKTKEQDQEPERA